MLLLLIGGALFALKKRRNAVVEIAPLMTSGKTSEIKNETQNDTASTTTTVSPPITTPQASSGDLSAHLTEFLKNLNTTSAKDLSAEDIQDEIKEIQSFLNEEEVVQKLNANQVSKDDREKLNQIFLRLQSVQEVRISRTLHDLEKDVNSYQKIHSKRVKKFVQNKEEDEEKIN